MREKSLKLIVSFHTTTAAMAMEKYCLANAVPGRLIPLPGEISAGCGMAWCAPPEERAAVEAAAARTGADIARMDEIMV